MPSINVNGTNFYYEEFGNPNAGETIAFLNGVMATTTSWKPLYPLFVEMGFRVILHDFKGQMKSDKPEGPYSFAEHAEETRALLKEFGVTRVHLIGTSYGGEVAMKYASMFPDEVKTLTIIDSVSEVDEICEGLIENWNVLCDYGDGERFFKGMAPSVYSAKYLRENKELMEARAKAFLGLPPEYLAGQKTLYETFRVSVHMTEELCRITCPALVICGEKDMLKPPKFSQIIADNIKNSEYVTLPDCGHVAIFEKPAELLSVISGFILKNLTIRVKVV